MLSEPPALLSGPETWAGSVRAAARPPPQPEGGTWPRDSEARGLPLPASRELLLLLGLRVGGWGERGSPCPGPPGPHRWTLGPTRRSEDGAQRQQLGTPRVSCAFFPGSDPFLCLQGASA